MQEKLKDVGVVIVSRELMLDGQKKVQVLIGKPRPFPNGDDWYCPHQTVGRGSGKVRYGAGVDAIQALIHALSMIGAELYCSDEYRDDRLIWDCGRNGNLGFPVTDNIRDVLPDGAQPW